jgi:type III secretion protein J
MKQKLNFSLFRTLCSILFLSLTLVTLSGCDQKVPIVNGVNQREANEIIVFLGSNGISAVKTQGSSGAGAQSEPKWDISVDTKHSTDAMAILNQNGLPRVKGVNLLDLFGKPSMMSSEKEGVIRYQAGLAEQIASTIRKIDGVLDADVQISFPPSDNSQTLPWENTTPPKVSAAVYVKHQGVLDDPNSHLITKIKRLVAGSVQDLDINDVTVISDKARFTDIKMNQMPQALSAEDKGYINIWSIVMSKSSASRFRTLFFFLSLFVVVFGTFTVWLLWKLYPTLKRSGGIKGLLNLAPFPSIEAASLTETLPEEKSAEKKPSEKENLKPTPSEEEQH